MIIKTRKRSFSLAVAILLSMATLLFTYSGGSQPSRLKLEKWALMADVMSLDLGISSLPRIADLGGYLINNSFRAVKNIVTGFPGRPEINRIDIDVKFLDYEKILSDRQMALDGVVSYYRQKVKASIRYNGTTYKAKIRLKGKSKDHYVTQSRMSLRVNLKGKNAIEGFRKFSLHKPMNRQYPVNHIFHKLIKQMGNLGATHKVVRVYFNGADWGMMDMQEHISTEMLEKQKVKDSLVFYLGSRDLVRYQRGALEVYAKYHLNNSHIQSDVFSSKKYLKDLTLRRYYSYVIKENAKANRKHILDTEAYSRTFLAAMIWNNEHVLNNVNCRHYFNPYILKLQPVTNDQGFFLSRQDHKALASEVFLDAMDIKDVIKQYNYFNENLIFTENNIRKIIADVQRYFPNDAPVDYSIIMNNIRQLKSDPDKFVNMFIDEMPIENSNLFLRSVSPTLGNATTRVMSSNVAKDILAQVVVHHFEDGTLKITNLLDVKLNLVGVYFAGKKMDVEVVEIPPYTQRNGVLIIKTNHKGILDGKFSVVTSLLGFEKTHIAEYTLLNDLHNPLLENNVPLPLFVKPVDGGYLIKKGSWKFTRPLVIDGALTVEPGAHLNFSKDSYLIVKGPLIARGEPGAEVVMSPLDGSWKGLYVLGAKQKSTLEYVHINKTSGVSDGVLNLTGGVTFYKSDVGISNSVLGGTSAEDALNIVRSNYNISGVKIINTRSDGFDSDFSIGTLSGSVFNDIGGDAVDFSGGEHKVLNVNISGVHDKGVSAGEGSKVRLSDMQISRVGVGVVAKDGSHVVSEKVAITDFKIHAAMSYMKKNFYEMPSLIISELSHDGVDPFFRQIGSMMTVDGQEIPPKNLDVKNLYRGEVMKK